MELGPQSMEYLGTPASESAGSRCERTSRPAMTPNPVRHPALFVEAA